MAKQPPGRLLKNDALPPGRDGQAGDKDAGSARSSATSATEDAVSRRPVRSGGRSFGLQRPPRGEARSSLLESFSYAFQGLVHVFRHQRNMQIHFGLAFLVLLGGLFFRLSRLELVAVFFAISLVLIAEMLNTALEETIDLVTSSYDPKAKIAKDVAAGAVLIAAINSLVVAYFVFADKAAFVTANVLEKVRMSPSHLTFVALILVVLLVIVLKARSGRLLALSGGLPSGHAAVAFAGWTAITFIVGEERYGVLVSVVTFFMALLTAQSRVEAHIHTTREVVLGAVLGILVTTLVFQLWFL